VNVDLSPISRSIRAVTEAQSPFDLAVQGAATLAAIAFGWLLARVLCRHSRISNRWKFGKGDFERVAFPAFALVFVWVARVILGALQETDTGPMEVANALVFALLAIRLAGYVLGIVMPEGGVQRAVIRVVIAVAWIAVILHMVGMLGEVTGALDSYGIHVGKNRTEITLLDVLRAAAALFFAFTIALWLSRVTETRVMAADSIELTTRVVIGKLVRIATLLAALFIALPIAGIDVTTLSIFSGALGVGLGFGLQKIASNYVSGFIVLLDRSLRIGDVVTVDGRRGEVRAIESRYTVIKGGDGVESIIPNETLITTTVAHHTYSDPRISVVVPVTVSYESDVDRALAILAEVGHGHKRVIAEPPLAARVKQLGAHGAELELVVWIRDPSVGDADLRSDILRDVLKAFRAAGIELAAQRLDLRSIPTPETLEKPSAPKA